MGPPLLNAVSPARARGELRRRVETVDIEDVLHFREVRDAGAAGLCAAHGLDKEGVDRLRTALVATHEAPLPGYRRLDTVPSRNT